MIEIILWYLSFQLIHLITLPFCLDIFKNLIDRGYSINKSFSFLMFSFFVYFFTRIVDLKFDVLSLILSLVSLVFISILSFLKSYKNMLKQLNELKKHIIISEVLFLSIFLLALFFKSFRPDLDHGEGPMDFVYIQSILRSEKLPPPYPWLVNINLENVYYYFGHFSYAIMIKLSGVMPSKGYVLALATTFALIGLSSFSIGYNLTKNYKIAFLCLFFITFGSSLLSLFHLLFSINPELQFNITEYRMTGDGNFLTRFFNGGQLFWWSTRVIPWTITEFPWFSLLWGDLHAHFVSYSFIFVFIHLMLDLLYSSRNGFEIFGSNFFEVSRKILVTSISLGYMFPQFIWNYPVYVGFLGIILFFVFYVKIHSWKFLLYFFSTFSLIVFFSIIIYFEPIKNLLELNPKRSGLNWEDLKTSLFNFLVLYGLQIFCIYTYLIRKIFACIKSKKSKKILIVFLLIYFVVFSTIFFSYFKNTKRFDGPIKVNWLSIKSLLYDFQILILLVPLTLVPFYFLIRKNYKDEIEMFLLISIFFGCLVVWLFELFNIYGRYVFVFKLHQSVWIFWNVSLTIIVFYFVNNLKFNPKNVTDIIFFLIFIVLSLSSIIYLIVTSTSETSKFTPNYGRNYLTIDSMEFIKQNYPNEYDAITWINKNIQGNHVILEYPSESYEFYPKPSTFTGLTAVVEWKGHAAQVTLKDTNEIAELVHTIYNSTDLNEVIKLIRELKVDYIYIGKLEKNNYLYDGLKKFENKEYFEEIYRNDEVSLFKFYKKD